MRVIEHGESVHMVMTDTDTFSVDTPADLEKVVDLMQEDVLVSEYVKMIQ